MEDDLKTIKIIIAGRIFPVKVDAQEELRARKLEEELNQKVNEFQATYPGRDKLDCVIMTLLTYAFDLTQSSPVSDMVSVNEKIHAIKTMLQDLPNR
ncbi:MAG: cell division protein ZapA [Saprospiraceae bacterium]